jgi:hypothetical protein
MHALRHLPFKRVLLLSGAWILLCVLVVAGWVLFQLRGIFIQDAGSVGVASASVGINELGLAIPVVPPIILIVMWIMARRLGRRDGLPDAPTRRLTR